MNASMPLTNASQGLRIVREPVQSAKQADVGREMAESERVRPGD